MVGHVVNKLAPYERCAFSLPLLGIACVRLPRIQVQRSQHFALSVGKQSAPLIDEREIEVRLGMVWTTKHCLSQTVNRCVEIAIFELSQPQVQVQIPILSPSAAAR
jgi:hypothetical protein